MTQQLDLLPPSPPRTVTIDVRGRPRPQGSMTLFRNGGSKYPAEVYVWRGQVQAAVAAAEEEPFLGAVELHLGFELPRPAFHSGTGKNRERLKPSAPPWPTVAPDLDKLVRCVSDAITDAGLWHDDAQVAVVLAAKRYTTDLPGVLIAVTELR